jgi:hypothetical protein
MNKLYLFLCLVLPIAGFGQQLPTFDEKDTGSMVKASYLYNFAKLVDWPSDWKKGNFIISVMGGGNVHQELVKKYNTKQIGSQQIEIRKLSRTLQISKCHVLFVGREYLDFLPEVTQALKDESTLIIAEGSDSLNKGAAIAFVYVDSNLKFELQVDNATNRNLFITSTLRSLAQKVQ